VSQNRVIHKVTLSLGLLSPPIPSFSGIRKVREIQSKFNVTKFFFLYIIKVTHWSFRVTPSLGILTSLIIQKAHLISKQHKSMSGGSRCIGTSVGWFSTFTKNLGFWFTKRNKLAWFQLQLCF
jgi:hypothetical protein